MRHSTVITKTNEECEGHLPNSNCITDGTTCIQGPKQCSDFKGNDEICQKFIASNGPCKASSFSSIPVNCTPKVCYEASNSFTTDQQCKDYHPSCKTNGRGCQSSIECGDYQINSACTANSQCLWINSCRRLQNICSSLTSLGESVCVNNPTKKSARYTGKDIRNDANCRDYICEDYDSSITTHEECMIQSNNKCTTTGAGCINYSICSSYTSSTICSSAQTTEASKKCIWDNSKCRQLQCSDLKGTSDIQ